MNRALAPMLIRVIDRLTYLPEKKYVEQFSACRYLRDYDILLILAQNVDLKLEARNKKI